MFKLIALFKGLDGINETAGEFWDLVLMPANESGQQISCGTASSFSAAQTLAGTIFQASLTWTTDEYGNQTHQTAAFTA
jgi:hypothetical protein